MAQGIIPYFSAVTEVLAGGEDPIALFIRTSRQSSTRMAYGYEISRFRDWLRAPLLEATLSDMQNWYEHLRDERKLAPATQLRKLSVLRALYKFLHEQRYIGHNPTLGLQMPKKTRMRQPRAMTLQEINALFAAIPRKGERGKRDYALFRLLLGNGARVSEVCNATIGDLGEELGHHILWLRVTKNGEPRRLALKPETFSAILDYLTASRGFVPGAMIEGAWRDAPLFLSTNRSKAQHLGAIGRQAVWKRFQWYGWRASGAAGLDPQLCHPHTLRHTAASWALQAGANVKQVADMLGHKNISTTNTYLQNIDDLGNNAAYVLPY